mmetsp:Transcript_19352/g.41998  ORF Transcript_19352/g.41998 Transcript_19352/m.41998 type:complete len:230 (+) Transcript_19352:333-1022(+)
MELMTSTTRIRTSIIMNSGTPIHSTRSSIGSAHGSSIHHHNWTTLKRKRTLLGRTWSPRPNILLRLMSHGKNIQILVARLVGVDGGLVMLCDCGVIGGWMIAMMTDIIGIVIPRILVLHQRREQSIIILLASITKRTPIQCRNKLILLPPIIINLWSQSSTIPRTNNYIPQPIVILLATQSIILLVLLIGTQYHEVMFGRRNAHPSQRLIVGAHGVAEFGGVDCHFLLG